MIFFRKTLMGLSLVAACCAHASEPLEEVIVTADFRAARLMNSVGSISVLGSRVIEERAARHLEEVLSAAPNISWSKGASRSRFIQMRGVGDLEQYAEPKYYPAVGLMIDELELAGGAGGAMLFDLAQVEVLRGPQGIRFGAGAHAGMVKLNSNVPGTELEAKLSGGAGNYGTFNLGGVVSGPLTKTLKARLAVQRQDSDGYVDNAFFDRDDLNNFAELAGRVLLQWEAGETSRYEAGVYAFDSENGYDAFSLDNDRTTWSDQPGMDEQDTLAVTARGDWQLGAGLNLRAVVTHMESDLLWGYDADWVSPPVCQMFTCSGGHDTATEVFARAREHSTLDVRLLGGSESRAGGDRRYTLGLYTNLGDENLDYAYPSVWYGRYENASTYETDRYAVYGEMEYAVSERLALSAGMRFERFEDDYQDGNGVAHADRDDLWNWKISAEYQVSDPTYAYASVALANKPGGANVAAGSQYNFLSPDFQTFMSARRRFAKETLFNREIGLKSSQMDDRLRLRGALFYATRKDAQLESWMWDDGAGLWIAYLDSSGDVESYGAELETSFAVNASLGLFANVGWLAAEVDRISTFDLDVFDFVTKTGREQAKSPEYQFNGGIRANFTKRLSATLEVEGRDASFFGYYHDGRLDGYELVHGSLSWASENLSIRLWGRNLTDEDYATHGLYFGVDPRDDFGAWSNRTYYQLGAPRTYGVNFSYDLQF